MDAWRRMIVCLDVRGCLHLSPSTVRLNVSISWPTSAGEDWAPTRSLFLGSRCFYLQVSSTVPWMLLVVSTCSPTSGTWHWRVKVEQRWVPPAPSPTRRCPPARRRARTPGAARTAPWWTPSGFFCKGCSPWWLSARWCVSVIRGLLLLLFVVFLPVSRISDSSWVMGDYHRPIGSLG